MTSPAVTSGHYSLQLPGAIPARRTQMTGNILCLYKNNTPSMQLSTKPAKKRRTVYGKNGDKPKQHLQF